MFRTLIVPLDGSELAERALSVAGELTRRSGAALTLLRVHVPPRAAMSYAYEWNQEIRGRETTYLTETAERLEASLGFRPETRLADGHAADAIREAADRSEAPLIVMSSHGLTGFNRVWIGSVTDAVIRRAHTPVLMVRAAEQKNATVPKIHTVIVPLDGSARAEEILPHAADMALAWGATLELLRVVDPREGPPMPAGLAQDAAALASRTTDELRATAARVIAGAGGVDVQVRVFVGESPANVIIAAAPESDCMIAMTTRAEGLARLVVGSVADKVIRGGPQMVLLLRPAD